ncbi:hypothetical protein BRPE64_DCDS00600 (plasmid) [Caballeronia insecticola]|uniref:Uncharacterized protein n=1 Tax=Caballeronia insecticola TaxID=758793 RepID=R4X2Y3_9BURK|nr:hypothetical protein BRPE64_DCDS00600 [Caballeronia insecticola]
MRGAHFRRAIESGSFRAPARSHFSLIFPSQNVFIDKPTLSDTEETEK